MSINYLTWISNLGVVPLFLFAAFLTFPIFTFLFARMFLVFAVLDAICFAPSLVLKQIKMHFVPFFASAVKGLAILATLCISRIYANETESIFVARGEQFELSLPANSQFSIGNREVIKYKYQEHAQKLILKGVAHGLSDLHIWNKKNRKKYLIFVTSKAEQLKAIKMAEAIKQLGLAADLKGQVIVISGEINQVSQLQELTLIIKKASYQILNRTILNKELVKKIIAEIYQTFLEQQIDTIACHYDLGEITCHYQGLAPALSNEIKLFQEKYNVHFQSNAVDIVKNNLKLKMKIYQYETTSSDHLQSGLHFIEGNLDQLFHSSLENMVAQNPLLFQSDMAQLSLVAEPESMINIGSTNEISVGSEIQFSQSQVVDGRQTTTQEWKFAGLKIKIKTEHKNNKIELQQQTELTLPHTNQISGTKTKGQLTILPNQTYQFFKIIMKQKHHGETSLPGLQGVPIIGSLLNKNQKMETYKVILTHIQLLEEED
jgi:hypothetical protein